MSSLFNKWELFFVIIISVSDCSHAQTFSEYQAMYY